MRRFAYCLLFCALVSGQLMAVAQTASEPTQRRSDELPRFILAGFQVYKDRGPEEAVRAWVKGGPLEGNKGALNQGVNLRRVHELYGGYEGFDVIGSLTFSHRTRIFYLIMSFEKGPLYGKFAVYRTEEGWVLTGLDFDTHYENIIPGEIGAYSHP